MRLCAHTHNTHAHTFHSPPPPFPTFSLYHTCTYTCTHRDTQEHITHLHARSKFWMKTNGKSSCNSTFSYSQLVYLGKGGGGGNCFYTFPVSFLIWPLWHTCSQKRWRERQNIYIYTAVFCGQFLQTKCSWCRGHPMIPSWSTRRYKSIVLGRWDIRPHTTGGSIVILALELRMHR